MNPIEGQNILVIVGGWNPYIIQDQQWIKKYLFPDHTVSSQWKMHQFPTFSHRVADIQIQLMGGSLLFSPLKNEDCLFELIETSALKLADYLPHTPVQAFGVNFSYVLDTTRHWALPSIENRTRLEQLGSIEAEKVQYSIRNNNYLLNLVIEQNTPNSSICNFNYHHSIKSLADFKEYISERHLIEYKNDSQRICDQILLEG